MHFWQAKTASEAAAAVVEESRREDAFSTSRRELSLQYGSLYEGMQLTSLSPYGYAIADRDQARFWGTDIPIIRNTVYAAVDTFVSAIAAEDPPLPALLTTEGSWKDRRQAQDLERLVEAEYKSPKGDYATLHELWVAGVRLLAASTGAILVRYYNDCGKVGSRIHDSLDARVGLDGTWCILRTWYEVDDAVDLFPEREADIRAAVSEPPPEWRPPTQLGFRAPEMVCIYEGWRGARGDKAGMYVAALDRAGTDALVHEEYPHERPPVVKLVGIPHLRGPWGHSFVHHAFESCFRDNAILQAIDRSVSKTNKQTTLVDTEKLVDKNALDKSDDNRIIAVEGPPTEAVHVLNAPGFNPQHLELANLHRSDVHDVTGVSEMHSAGQREPGLDSEVAQRFVADLINKRFADFQRRYIQAVAVDSAKIIIQILCDIYEEDRRFTRTWPGQDSLREISASVALNGIERIKYLIQPAAVSGSHNSPADREQTAFELYRSGALSQDAYAGLQRRGYDLPRELGQRDVQSEWFERQMYKYQFAPDKDVQKPDFYSPPVRGIDVPRATLQVIDGFMTAQLEQLEDERLDYYLMLLADLSAMAASGSEPLQNPQLAPAPPQRALPPPTAAPVAA